MNNSPFRKTSIRLNVTIQRARSLLDIKALLGLYPAAQPKRIFTRIAPVTRWNE